MFVLVMTYSFVSTAPPFRKGGKMAGVASEMLVSSCRTTQNHELDQPYNIRMNKGVIFTVFCMVQVK